MKKTNRASQQEDTAKPSGRRDVSKPNPESTEGPQNDQPQGEGVKSHLSFSDPQSPLAMEGHSVHARYCPTLCDPMDCSPPGSSVHGFSRQEYCSRLPFPPPGIFPTQGSNPGFLHCSHQGGPSVLLRSLNFPLGGKSLQQEAECWN